MRPFFYSVYQGRQRILATFEKDARQITAVISGAIVNDLYVGDLRLLRQHLESARTNPDVSYIYVTDLKGAVLADGTKENPLKDQQLTDDFSRDAQASRSWISRAEGKLLKVGGPVRTPDGDYIGHLHVGFSLRSVDQMIGETTRMSLYITLICLGIGALLADFLSTTFSRPIWSIAQAATEIGEGKLDTRLAVKRNDELGMLAQSVNQMAEALQGRDVEIKRGQEKLQARYQELEILHDIGQRVLSAPELKPVLEKVLDQALSAISLDMGNIRLFGPGGGILLGAYRGYQNPENIYLHRARGQGSYPGGGGLISQVLASRNSLVVEDVPGSGGMRTLKREGVRSAIIIPISTQEEALGVIEVGSRAPRKFQPEEIRLLEAVGDQMGLAVQKAWLLEESQRNLQHIRALQEINTAITSTLDLRTVLDLLLEKIDLSLPYPAATVRLFNKESGLLEPVACRNLDEREWKTEKWKAGRGLANVVFETRVPMIVNDCRTDARVRDLEFYRKQRLVSYLGVPLMVKGEALGVLSFYTKQKHEFIKEEIEFLSALAGEAAVAINNARLYEETERRRREAEELARVAQSLTESLDMTAVGERIATSVLKLFGVRASTLRLLQPDGSLRTLASTGEGLSFSSGGEVLPTGTGLASVAVAESRPIWSADVLNEPRIRLSDQMRDYQLRSGNRSMIAVPLRVREKMIGSLGLADRTGRAYSDSEVALLQTFADQAAIALQNAGLFEEVQQKSAELEKANKIQADFSAMIVHDVRGSLGTIIGVAGMLEDGRLGSVKPEQKKWLVKIGAHGRRLADLVNDFLDLSKLEAGHLNLEKERVDLQMVIENSLDGHLVLAQDKGIAIRSKVAPAFPRLHADSRRLDQVLGNLINNAVKFTPQGGEIEVGASVEGGVEAKIWVKDNGVGIPAQEIGEIFQKYRQTRYGKAFQREGTGLGLVICKMIVEAHGGRIWVESDEGKGSTFYFNLPL
ncbi:MAG: GAF domain-containing protein [Deltaproteobacteria bacterium]|nr:GAF domain-containing protein [Deltaproteobacteria bacterium]